MKAKMPALLLLALVFTLGAVASNAQAQPAATSKTILVVDRGNIQRSVVAQLVLQRIIKERGLELRYRVISRGMQGTPASPEIPMHNNLRFYSAVNGSAGMEWENSEPTLRELGLLQDFTKHKATVLSRKDLEEAALVISLDTPTVSDPIYGIEAQFKEFRGKVMLFTELVGSGVGIADGYGSSDPNRHRQLILDVERIARQGFDELMRRLNR
jgi:protein-tyrosine-phosphatase